MKAQLKAHDDARTKAKEEVASLRSSLKFRSVEDIDAEVARLEYLQQHTTMSIKEDKEIVKQIKELNKSKALVDVHAEKAGKLTGGEDDRKALWDRIKEKDVEVTALYNDRNALRDALAAFRAKEEAKTADVPALQEERTKVWDLIQASRTNARKAREAQKAAEDAWWANEKLLRAQERIEKQKKCVAAQRRRHRSAAAASRRRLQVGRGPG
jgi:uncharacterized coiled-coil DUF342 family protein